MTCRLLRILGLFTLGRFDISLLCHWQLGEFGIQAPSFVVICLLPQKDVQFLGENRGISLFLLRTEVGTVGYRKGSYCQGARSYERTRFLLVDIASVEGS